MPHRRTYETNAIRVHWDSSRCIHTGLCLRALPAVFDVRTRPWVDLSGADADAVAAVERCPTGANSHLRRGWRSGPSHDPASLPPPPRDGAASEPTSVVPLEDASLDLGGHLRVYHSDGRPMLEAGRAVLCRCGQSATKPFCDRSHEAAAFRSRPPEVPRDRLEGESPAAFTPNPRVPAPSEVGD